ncbi:MAG TPA: methyltransferase domain-containing protein [Flavobacterium sp.]|jgi:SAM-dependent methyltransferase
MISTKYRSDAPEIMDDFAMEGEILRDALDKIATINQLLGGNKVTLQGVKQLLKNVPKERNIHIIDVGCGNGDMLRAIAKWGTQHHRSFTLTGIDANAFTIAHAKTLSADYQNIDYKVADIFVDFENLNCDIALCTLTLHHFKDAEILKLMRGFVDRANVGVVINDLHRSKLAYNLFKMICFLFNLNKMSAEDGLVSILRGFKREDLVAFSKQLNLNKFTIRWKWAFRYQWIISNI